MLPTGLTAEPSDVGPSAEVVRMRLQSGAPDAALRADRVARPVLGVGLDCTLVVKNGSLESHRPLVECLGFGYGFTAAGLTLYSLDAFFIRRIL